MKTYFHRLVNVAKRHVSYQMLLFFCKSFGFPKRYVPYLKKGKLRNDTFLDAFGKAQVGMDIKKNQVLWCKMYDRYNDPYTLTTSEKGKRYLNELNKHYPELFQLARIMKIKIVSGPMIQLNRFMILGDETKKPANVAYMVGAAVIPYSKLKKNRDKRMFRKAIGNYDYFMFIPDSLPYLVFRFAFLHEMGHMLDFFKKITHLEEYSIKKEYRDSSLHKKVSSKNASIMRGIKETIKMHTGKKGDSETFANNFAKSPTHYLKKHAPELLVYRK